MTSFPSPPKGAKQQFVARPRWDFQLIIREQPVHSRMCGVGERVDRRPIDPPPIVQLKILGQDSMNMMNSLQAVSPYIFLAAVLVPGDTAEDATEQPLQIDYHRKLTIGRTVSSLYLLRDLDNTEGAFFAFSDISVRADGRYRLRMCLFEMLDSGVQFRQSVLSDIFTVYSAKKFPGMHLSCPLACHFAEQGLKIRIRKESRKRSIGTRSIFDTSSDGCNEADCLNPDSDTQKRHSITSVTSGELSGYSSENVALEAVSCNSEKAGDNIHMFADAPEAVAGPSTSKYTRSGVSSSSAATEHAPKKHLSSVIYSSSVGLHVLSSPSSGELPQRVQLNQSNAMSHANIDSIADVITTTHHIAIGDSIDYPHRQSTLSHSKVHKDSYVKLPPLQSFDGSTPRSIPFSILTAGEQDQQWHLQHFHGSRSKRPSYYDDHSSSRETPYPNSTLLPLEFAAAISTARPGLRPDRPELVVQSSRSRSMFDQQNSTVLPPLREQLQKIGVQSSVTEDNSADQDSQSAFPSQR